MEIPSVPIDPFLLQAQAAGARDISGEGSQQQEKLKKVARDFETVFLHQVLNVMKDSVPDEESEDSTGEQIQGMYWSFMAQAIGEEGGVGLWKEIHSAIASPSAGYERLEQPSTDKSILDETI